MKNDNGVIFKGNKDGITILLDQKSSFDDIVAGLQSKAAEARNFFSDATTAISFKGRSLTEAEEDVLLRIIQEKTNLNISFVKSKGGYLVNSEADTSREAEETRVFTPSIHAEENTTIYHIGSLRSGQSIKYTGSVVVIGDINPGAEIIAEGNIVVMGTVKGLVHAGCSGNYDCVVSALNLIPVQLRIADIIAYIPKELATKNKNKIIPSYAYVLNKQIYVAPLINS